LETVPVVVQETVERRRLGAPARFVLLCLGFAVLGAAIGLLATATWVWAVVLLLLAIALLAALAEATHRGADRVQVETQHAERFAGADERIRDTCLPVQETIMVSPREPHPPYPPPDEGNPPEPAQVPEPYPPPDEGTPPAPEPDPGETERE
jgi:hypothetical protein